MAFETGEILFSRGVYAQMETSNDFAQFVLSSLERHKKEDWDDMSIDDQMLNDHAVHFEQRIFASYQGKNKIWIITEWNRSVTTILLPYEY